jgi:hypothetical protein
MADHPSLWTAAGSEADSAVFWEHALHAWHLFEGGSQRRYIVLTAEGVIEPQPGAQGGV